MGNTSKQFKAVLFDLDGTLLDTIDDLADSMNLVLASHGLKTYPVKDYFYFVGDGMEKLILRVLGEAAQDLNLVRLCFNEMHQLYQKKMLEKTKPYSGILELLSQLQSLSFRMAILSNKPDAMTKSIVKHFFPGQIFELVLGARPDFNKKPDPAAALYLASEMQLAAETFLYLGDTNTDMQTAVSAGMFPVGVLWGFRSEDELKKSGAKLLLQNPMDLIHFIKS